MSTYIICVVEYNIFGSAGPFRTVMLAEVPSHFQSNIVQHVKFSKNTTLNVLTLLAFGLYNYRTNRQSFFLLMNLVSLYSFGKLENKFPPHI